MAETNSLSEQSLVYSKEVVAALDKVGLAFSEVDNLTSKIANGTEEQRESTNSINDNVSNIVEIGHKVTQNLVNIAEGAELQRITSVAVDDTLARISL